MDNHFLSSSSPTTVNSSSSSLPVYNSSIQGQENNQQLQQQQQQQHNVKQLLGAGGIPLFSQPLQASLTDTNFAPQDDITMVPLPQKNPCSPVIYVNSKQYTRILKRRLARSRMKSNLNSYGVFGTVFTPEDFDKKKSSHQKRQLQASKRSRNTSGQFI